MMVITLLVRAVMPSVVAMVAVPRSRTSVLSSSESSKSWTPLSSRSWRLPSSRTGQPGVDVGDGVRVGVGEGRALGAGGGVGVGVVDVPGVGLGPSKGGREGMGVGVGVGLGDGDGDTPSEGGEGVVDPEFLRPRTRTLRCRRPRRRSRRCPEVGTRHAGRWRAADNPSCRLRGCRAAGRGSGWGRRLYTTWFS